MKMNFDFKEIKKYLGSAILICLGVIILFILFSGKVNPTISDFLSEIENKTFDLRQKITSISREHNKNIVILAIDDSTYENIIETYGEWPMPRYIYADIVNYIEKQNPKLIAFDLLFSKNIKDKYNSDEKLAEIFKNYDNLYTSMNFDKLDKELREPPKVNDKLAINLINNSNLKIEEFTNFRPIIPEIVNNTSHIGHINFQRADDGVIRDVWPFVSYQDKIYPHLVLLVGQNLLNSNTKDFIIDRNLKLIFDKFSFPIIGQSSMILNWYALNKEKNTDVEIFEHIPLWKVIKSIENEKVGKAPLLEKNFFKDKIIYVGSTSPNLNDIKTVPIVDRLPGVELHTTFINNMIDNSFIHRLTFKWDFIITLILCLFIGLSMLRVEYSKINYKYLIPINFSILTGTIVFYYILSVLVMKYFYLWIAIIMPTVGMILTFTLIYVIRYFFKSKDYEYTYRLATTDGLTELYNHRYFQEKMIENIENCKKSGKKFSLILTDIDFFKKFNDQYGHQAGDAVLRQVARTLKKNVKKTDLVCRYGGEEMSVILKNADNKAAMKVAQRLCEAVAKTIYKLSATLDSHVTISLGVATYPDNGSTPTELIEYSDKGLYVAKENGRNQVGVVKN